MNKIALLLAVLLVVSLQSFSQEVNIGASVGIGPALSNKGIVAVGAVVEFQPKNTILSVNLEPAVLLSSKESIYTVYPERSICSVPVYLKVILGKKLRFCPFMGGFITTTSAYGLTTGLIIEYKIQDKFFVFLKNDYNYGYYSNISRSHFGSNETYNTASSSLWINLGFKVNVFKPRTHYITI